MPGCASDAWIKVSQRADSATGGGLAGQILLPGVGCLPSSAAFRLSGITPDSPSICKVLLNFYHNSVVDNICQAF